MSERAAMLAERLAKYGVSALDEAEPLVVAQVPETAQVVWQNAQGGSKSRGEGGRCRCQGPGIATAL
jgi:hypothetical protein